MSGWVGCDLDGTLAEYHGWVGPGHIGAPIPRMVERIKKHLANGDEVRIVTARVGRTEDYVESSQMRDDDEFALRQEKLIQDYCEEHLGQRLRVTCKKDYGMWRFYDDRAIQIVENTGMTLEEYHADLLGLTTGEVRL